MTKAHGPKPKPVNMACGHTLYFTIYPHLGEQIYCPKCETYEYVGNPDAQFGKVFHEDFWSKPNTRGSMTRYDGGCTIEDCTFTTDKPARNWFVLRDLMQKHVMQEHTRFGSTLVIEEVDYSGRPPF